jgi:hypothetical protein
MNPSQITRRIARLGLAAILFCAITGASRAEERKLEARLIWGTNDDKSPNPAHKLLEGDIARKLRDTFKWKNYFQVNSQHFTINDKDYKKVVMSDKCYIEVKDKGDSKVTVKLYGEGKMTQRIDKPLPKDETLAIGGDVKNTSAWFVTVRPVPPQGKAPQKPAANAAAKPAVK